MKCVELTKLLRDVNVEYISDRKAFDSFSISSISTDTRSLHQDDVFIALPGENYDGHSFIGDALKGGARGILFDAGWFDRLKQYVEKPAETLFVGLKNTRKSFGKIAENYLGLFSVKKIVVTGSAGKTTTKGLISSVLSQRYNVVESIRSYNNDVGVPKTILGVDDATDILVQELGTNHPGEITYLSGIVHQDCAVVINVGPAHIGFFGSEENIAREKKCAVEVLDRRGTAFLNADDKYFSFMKEGLAAKVKSFGLHGGDLYPESIISIDVEGSEFILSGKRITTRVLGEHGILNATAAALVGFEFGLTIDEIKRGIEEYRDERGRGNIYIWQGVTIIDESYNANPLSVTASLRFLGKTRSEGKKVLVLGDMLELGTQSEQYHRKITDGLIKNGISDLYTYGKLARITGEDFQRVGGSAHHYSDVQQLIDSLKKGVKSGDIILVIGSRKMELEKVVQGFVIH
jgi:UDP-N-acetylmuramoyl-tripeptide--D-alanyl-D-alanine ligase